MAEIDDDEPIVITVAGQLEFEMDHVDAERIAYRYQDPQASDDVANAFATSLAGGVDGVELEDIIIQDVITPYRRLAGRKLQDASDEDSALMVNYTILVSWLQIFK